jgi:hypothetical protein
VKPAGDGHRKGISNTMKVKVVPWDGRVEVQLMWESGANLNLQLDGPDGVITAEKPGPTKSGGTFNPESTPGCGGPSSIEAISWPNHKAPVGGYYAHVTLPSPLGCDGDANPEWRLEVLVNGKVVETANGSGEEYYAVSFGEGQIW